jgi:aspartate carbamoyltransferase catalytic subunit
MRLVERRITKNPLSSNLTGRDLVSILDFSRDEVEQVFDYADLMEPFVKSGRDDLKGSIISTIFFEPSTRTRLSFETAMLRLGGHVVGFADPSMSRTVTGETLADTTRMVDSYSNVIVLRHKIEGSARLAAEVAEVPVVNAGDGSQHHPTQTLTDLYTLRKELDHIDGLKIAILGDLRQTRSASSLAYGLGLFRSVKLYLVSPDPLKMRPEVTDYLSAAKVEFEEASTLDPFLPEIDALYVTRLQKERFPDPTEYEKLKGSYFITRKMLEPAKKDMIVMHHLPRIDDIPLEIDSTPFARYFQQAAYGLPVRMALLSSIVERGGQGRVPRDERRESRDWAEEAATKCPNKNCITSQPKEPTRPRFRVARKDPLTKQCYYCGRYFEPRKA